MLVRIYSDKLSASENAKGVLDVDTVKGCEDGMTEYPDGGCYGECYAAKTAKLYGIDFTKSVSRRPYKSVFLDVFFAVKKFRANWYRIGTAGDPSFDWENTVDVCEKLKPTSKHPVIITKHWTEATDDQLSRLKNCGAVINTSTSGFDTDAEIKHRVNQIGRVNAAGMRSVNRIVSCEFGDTEWGRVASEKQDYLFSIGPTIDNPLRASKTSKRVLSGDVIVQRVNRSVGGGKFVSLKNKAAYLSHCETCPDQCGIVNAIARMNNGGAKQSEMIFN